MCDARRDEGASEWKPPPLQAIHGGYITTRHDYALAEGCRRLDVTMVEVKTRLQPARRSRTGFAR